MVWLRSDDLATRVGLLIAIGTTIIPSVSLIALFIQTSCSSR